MKQYFLRLTVILILLPFGALAQNNVLCKIMDMEQLHAKKRFNHKSAARTAEYDVNYYRLELDLDPTTRFISGSVTTYFTSKVANLTSMVLDFGDMLIADSIQYHGLTDTNMNTSGSQTIEVFIPNATGVQLNVLDSITIFYRGIPRGGSGAAPFARVAIAGGNLIWTLSEPYGAHEWWPCKNDLTDKADSVEIIVTTPQINRVASNGLLLSIDTVGTDATYHWKTTYPTVSYLVAVAVGAYDFYEQKYALNSDSLLIQHFLYQNQSFNLSHNAVVPFLHFFDSLLGEYPFIKEKYGHASFSFGGGMEHQTISFMGSYGGELKAHELAHQWFGNKVTCGSWSDLWLNESFATYLTGLTYDFNIVHSNAFWQVWLRGTENGALAFPNGSVYRPGNDTTNTSILFNNQVYGKGAMVLHTLRWQIGDSAFFAGMKNFINDTNLIYSFAKTPDLIRHMETASGQNLSEFFNDWVYGAGHPTINTYWSQNATNFDITVQQTPTDTSVSFYNVALPYRLIGLNIDTIIIVDPSSISQLFSLNISQQIDTVIFDPNNNIFAAEGFTTSLNSRQLIKNALKLYPNPAKDELSIQIAEGTIVNSIQLYDIHGKTISVVQNLNGLDISSLSNGLYFISIDTNRGMIKEKFQKIN